MSVSQFSGSLGLTETARLDALVFGAAPPDAPGVAVAVLHKGNLIYQRVRGLASLAHQLPLTDRSVVRIASQSKQFTVMMILMLEAEGKLSLEDDIRDHFPWLPDWGSQVTLGHLASNSSGIRDILDSMIMAGIPITAPSSRSAAKAIVARQKTLNFAPMTDVLYSNSNFLLLSELIEKVTGKSFNEALEHYITGPLGMTDTQLMVRDDEIYPRLADHHRRGPQGQWLKSAWGIAIGGEGGLVSTLADMIIWQQNLLEPKVGTAEMIERMGRPYVTINDVASPYGLGLVNTRHKGVSLVGHGGWIAGSRSESFRATADDVSIIVLSNHDDFSSFGLARDMLDIVLGRDPGGVISPEGIAALKTRYGFWRSDDGSFVLALEESSGLPAIVGSMGVSALEEAEPGKFHARGSLPPFVFSLNTDGSILTETFGRSRRYRRVEAPGQIGNDLFGTYGSAESGLTASIDNVDGRRIMRVTSPFGAALLSLDACDADMYLARPSEADIHDQWRIAPWVLPWLYTVRIGSDAIVFNSDRGRDVVLARLA
ncbi:serine hydrolase domain-containing protein [Aminobacter carboxidus]|uniref:Beta-lactamase family protein n=1 Tax=Aminobacter carboxidus TaxID=376165 RepID=A0A8E1WKI5_9HYPH|nr:MULTISPECIES: serine hydrolase domain-containing protein [Aminobacter carboxidus group]MBB6470208.1 CubicO group peptidase (beta-lactamase class C family) [Aminobacter lissarensis]MBE1205060.1 beta-lactamase family protein [Aminobacter carboxidus]